MYITKYESHVSIRPVNFPLQARSFHNAAHFRNYVNKKMQGFVTLTTNECTEIMCFHFLLCHLYINVFTCSLYINLNSLLSLFLLLFLFSACEI